MNRLRFRIALILFLFAILSASKRSNTNWKIENELYRNSKYILLEEDVYRNQTCDKINKDSDTGDSVDDDEILTVHLIPHSHDDYGWLKTPLEYFNHSHGFGENTGVRDIINSVFQELKSDPKKKFAQVEVGFLYMWWQESSEQKRAEYIDLVAKGQIELINGGWVMHDEATPYYEDIIDQMTVGHQWLLKNLRVIPTVGWQIDPFGHQATNAALFSQMGFNGWWFSRIDYQDKAQRKKDKSFEMIWNPKQNSGKDHSIFTGIHYDHYRPPNGFNFDAQNKNSNEQITDSNIQRRAQQFVNYFNDTSKYYRSNHFMQLMGEDFNFSNAKDWYKNIDRLIEYINDPINGFSKTIRIQYSTPSLYLKQVHQQSSKGETATTQRANPVKFPIQTDDFFPYADKKHAYWTGYFTSRVAFKGMTRDFGRYLQHIRNIFSVAFINKSSKYLQENTKDFFNNLQQLQQDFAAIQHHDGVSGTAKQYVTNDFISKLLISSQQINTILYGVLQEYTSIDLSEKVGYSQCHWNATLGAECVGRYQLEGNQSILLSIHNPTVARSLVIRVKASERISSHSILDSQNNLVYGELFCKSSEECDLFFKASFDAYSIQHFKIVSKQQQQQQPSPPPQNQEIKGSIKQIKESPNEEKPFQVSANATLTIKKDSSQFTLSQRKEGSQKAAAAAAATEFQEDDFEIQYNYYEGHSKDNYPDQSSGAYIFRPSDTFSKHSFPYANIKATKVFVGELVTVVHLEGQHIFAQLRLYPESSSQHKKQTSPPGVISQKINGNIELELETFIDSIPLNNVSNGKEIVLHVNTSIQNNNEFSTDSNGLELQERKLNSRGTWKLEVDEEVSGNYYPVNGIISIEDRRSKRRVSIVNDRSQGGTSLIEGQLELMIHRRLLLDDGRGVGEGLNEQEIDNNNNNVGLKQKVRHYVVFEHADSTRQARAKQNSLDNSPIVFIAKSDTSQFGVIAQNILASRKVSLLAGNDNPFLKVYLIPIEEETDYFLMRLNNLNDSDDARIRIPSDFLVIEELTLTANQWKSDWLKKKYEWKTEERLNPKISITQDCEESICKRMILSLFVRPENQYDCLFPNEIVRNQKNRM